MISIISNISSKSKPQIDYPFFIVNGKRVKIKKDEILIDNTEPLIIEAGYVYGGEKLVHLSTKIIPTQKNEYYLYKVGLLLDGKGKIKKIGKMQYQLYRMYRKWRVIFLLGILVLLYLIRYWIFIK